jgi:hypothetical protein
MVRVSQVWAVKARSTANFTQHHADFFLAVDAPVPVSAVMATLAA